MVRDIADRLRTGVFPPSHNEDNNHYEKLAYNVMIGFLAFDALAWLGLGIYNQVIGQTAKDQDFAYHSYVTNSCLFLSLTNVAVMTGLAVSKFLGKKLCNNVISEPSSQRQEPTRWEYCGKPTDNGAIQSYKKIALFYLINTIFYYSLSLYHVKAFINISRQEGVNDAAILMYRNTFFMGTIFAVSLCVMSLGLSCFKKIESSSEPMVDV